VALAALLHSPAALSQPTTTSAAPAKSGVESGAASTPPASSSTAAPSTAAPASVEPVDPKLAQYKQLITRALEEFDARNFEEATALLDQAYAVRPTARVLRGLGKVRFEQRQYVRALEAFDGSLTATLDPLTDSMRDEVSELRTRAASYVGEIRIETDPADAVVTLDGRELKPGFTAPIRLDMGAHSVSATAKGYQAGSRTVDVVGGSLSVVSLKLTRQEANVLVIHNERDRTGLWVTAGLGVGLVGATVGSAIWTINRMDAANRCSEAETAGVTCITASTINSERDAALATLVVSSVLTAAASVTFAVLLSSSDDDDKTKPSARVYCTGEVGGARCGLWGTW